MILYSNVHLTWKTERHGFLTEGQPCYLCSYCVQVVWGLHILVYRYWLCLTDSLSRHSTWISDSSSSLIHPTPLLQPVTTTFHLLRAKWQLLQTTTLKIAIRNTVCFGRKQVLQGKEWRSKFLLLFPFWRWSLWKYFWNRKGLFGLFKWKSGFKITNFFCQNSAVFTVCVFFTIKGLFSWMFQIQASQKRARNWSHTHLALVFHNREIYDLANTWQKKVAGRYSQFLVNIAW